MERIYLNRVGGQERIQVEITDTEIGYLLDDLKFPEQGDAFEATKRFEMILRDAAKALDIYHVGMNQTEDGS